MTAHVCTQKPTACVPRLGDELLHVILEHCETTHAGAAEDATPGRAGSSTESAEVPPKKCAAAFLEQPPLPASSRPQRTPCSLREAVPPHLCLFSALNASVSWPRPAAWRAFFPDTNA